MEEMYDVIMVGKGPAAISAGIYTSRSNYKTLLIGKESALEKTDKIDNYYGFEDTISGKELLDRGEKQIKRFGAEIIIDEVINIESYGDYYMVSTASREFKAKAVLLSTGQTRKKLNVKKLDKYEGSGVSYCVICDGFFFRNKKVGLVGFSEYMVHEAEQLSNFTKDVIVFTDGQTMEKAYSDRINNMGFAIETRKLSAVEGENKVEHVIMDDETEIPLEGLFIAYGTAGSADFARKLGIKINGTDIIVDPKQSTGIKGIYAAGDCTGGLKQIATAVGQGAIAGVEIINYLKKYSNS